MSTPATPTDGRRRDAALRAVRRAGHDLVGLVLPVSCAGCGAWDVALCSVCAGRLHGVHRCEGDVPRLDRLDGCAPLPVWAGTSYEGPVRATVVAWKDRGRRDLGPVLAACLCRAVEAAAPGLARAAVGASLAVVPVPTSARARRRRGEDLTAQLARAAAAALRAGGTPARAVPLLRAAARRDQVGLGARDRARNAAGRVVVRGAAGRHGDLTAGVLGGVPAPVLLVDDVVTTGATLAACSDALEDAGRLVLGAVVVAATPGPSVRRAPLLVPPRGD